MDKVAIGDEVTCEIVDRKFSAVGKTVRCLGPGLFQVDVPEGHVAYITVKHKNEGPAESVNGFNGDNHAGD